MRLCPQCQQSMPIESQFCTNCGSKSAVNEKKKKKPILPILALMLAGGLFITHDQLKEKTAPAAVIAEFETILAQKDERAALSLFAPQLHSVEASDETMTSFLDYVESETDWRYVVDEWKHAAEQDSALFEAILTYNGDRLFTLEETGSLLGIYPTYDVILHPYILYAQSTAPDTKVEFEGKSKTVTAENEFERIGSFLPAVTEQELSYSLDSKFAEIQETIPFSNVSDGSNNVYVELPIEAGHVTVNSTETDAVVFINNTTTGKTVKDIGEIGPIPLDGTVTVHAELDGNTSYYEEIYEDGAVELVFEDEENDASDWQNSSYYDSASEGLTPSKEELDNLYNDFQSAAIDAINERNYSLVANYYHSAGLSGPESADYINYLKSKGITEQLLDATVVDYDVTDQGILLHTFESYIIYYNDGTNKQRSFNSEHLLMEEGSEWKFYKLVSTTEI